MRRLFGLLGFKTGGPIRWDPFSHTRLPRPRLISMLFKSGVIPPVHTQHGWHQPTSCQSVEVVHHGLALRLQAKAALALPVSRDPEVSDGFAPMCRHNVLDWGKT